MLLGKSFPLTFLSSTSMQTRKLSQLGRGEKCRDELEYVETSPWKWPHILPCVGNNMGLHGVAKREGLQDCSRVFPGILETVAKPSLCSHKGFGYLLRELVDSKGVCGGLSQEALQAWVQMKPVQGQRNGQGRGSPFPTSLHFRLMIMEHGCHLLEDRKEKSWENLVIIVFKPVMTEKTLKYNWLLRCCELSEQDKTWPKFFPSIIVPCSVLPSLPFPTHSDILGRFHLFWSFWVINIWSSLISCVGWIFTISLLLKHSLSWDPICSDWRGTGWVWDTCLFLFFFQGAAVGEGTDLFYLFILLAAALNAFSHGCDCCPDTIWPCVPLRAKHCVLAWGACGGSRGLCGSTGVSSYLFQ